mmetsp:Transcript_19295/g.28737  ORF Transcript_19295/g.28737 Transcript_19295/m.28737 type:complete len:123 (-) Transcript_19295:177-545(-)
MSKEKEINRTTATTTTTTKDTNTTTPSDFLESLTGGGGSSNEQSIVIPLKPAKPKKSVRWTSDVIDNEHLGRKSSKSFLSLSLLSPLYFFFFSLSNFSFFFNFSLLYLYTTNKIRRVIFRHV